MGTLRANKKDVPKEILVAKLKRGEMVAKLDQDGIVEVKWKDKRDVRILSTKHAPIMVPVRSTQSCQSTQISTTAQNSQSSTSAQPSTSAHISQASASAQPSTSVHRH